MFERLIVKGRWAISWVVSTQIAARFPKISICVQYLVARMNGNLSHALPYPLNYLGGRLITPQARGQPSPVYPESNITNFRGTAASLTYYHTLQAQTPLDKTLALSFIQHQFIHRFAFNNSEHFHPPVKGQVLRSFSSSNICDKAGDDLVIVLAEYGDKPYTTSISDFTEEETRSDGGDLEDIEVDDSLKHKDRDSMHPRGLKYEDSLVYI